jgi:hypothetical protein
MSGASVVKTIQELSRQIQSLRIEFHKLKVAFGLEIDKNDIQSAEALRRDQDNFASVIKSCNLIKNSMLEAMEKAKCDSQLDTVNAKLAELESKVSSIDVKAIFDQILEHSNEVTIENDEYISNLIQECKDAQEALKSASNEVLQTISTIAKEEIQENLQQMIKEERESLQQMITEERKNIDEMLENSNKSYDERSCLKFDDLKTIVLNFLKECRENMMEFVKKDIDEHKQEIAKTITEFTEKKTRELPECDVAIVHRDADVKNITIGPNGTGIEMNGSILSISRQDNLVCNDGALINTIDDCDAIAVIDSRSRYKDENIVGRYVEYTDYDVDTGIFEAGVHGDLSNKVFAIVKEFIPKSRRTIIHKHHIINLDEDKNYIVIALQGITPVRVKECKYHICDILVPNGDGLYTNDIGGIERLGYVLSKHIPMVRVLKSIAPDMIIGIIC